MSSPADDTTDGKSGEATEVSFTIIKMLKLLYFLLPLRFCTACNNFTACESSDCLNMNKINHQTLIIKESSVFLQAPATQQ